MQGARKLAASALHYRFHDNLARMFCALGSLGAAEGLLLPGANFTLFALFQKFTVQFTPPQTIEIIRYYLPQTSPQPHLFITSLLSDPIGF